ncbi:MAG: 50S ribosomal protein L29 [Candidatus Aenigmatarchaeota archaeon]
MAILKAEEIEEMGEEELEKKLDELELELAKEKAQVKIGGVPENAGRMNEMKRTIARIKTKLSKTR